MPYSPDPFSAIPYASLVQSAPLHQALAPLANTQQGQGGSMGAAPFVSMPPAQPHGFGRPPHFASMSLPQLAYSTMGSAPPWTAAGWGTPPVVGQPNFALHAMHEMQVRGGAMASGLTGGSMRFAGALAASPLITSALFGALGASPQILSHLGVGVTGALRAGSMTGMAGQLGMGALRGMGTLAGAIGPQAIALAGLYAGSKVIGYGLQGAQQFGTNYNMLQAAYGGMAGLDGGSLVGMGVGTGTVRDITSTMRSMTTQPFQRMEQGMSNLQRLMDSGQLTVGARNAKDLSANMEKAFDTMTELMKALNTTFDEAGKMFEQIKRMGISNKRAMVEYALNSRTQAGVIGIPTEQLMQLGAEGASIARGMGMFGAGGAATSQGLATSFAAGLRGGYVSEEVMREVAGGTLDPTEASRRLMGRTLQFTSGMGRYLIAGGMGADGKIDANYLQALRDGKLSMSDILSRGTQNLNTTRGLLSFTGNRERLTSQFLEGLGSDLTGTLYQLARNTAREVTGTGSEDMMRTVLMQQMGFSEAEASLVIQSGSPQAIRQRQRLEAESRRSAARTTMLGRQGNLGSWWERGPLQGIRENIGAPFQGWFSDLAAKGAGAIERFQRQAAGDLIGYDEGPMMGENIRALMTAPANVVLGGRPISDNPNMTADQLMRRGMEMATTGLGNRYKQLIGAPTSAAGFEQYSGGNMPGFLRAAQAMAGGAQHFGNIFGGRTMAVADALMSGNAGDVFTQNKNVWEAFKGGRSDATALADMVGTLKVTMQNSGEANRIWQDALRELRKANTIDEKQLKSLEKIEDVNAGSISGLSPEAQRQIGMMLSNTTASRMVVPNTSVFGYQGLAGAFMNLGLGGDVAKVQAQEVIRGQLIDAYVKPMGNGDNAVSMPGYAGTGVGTTSVSVRDRAAKSGIADRYIDMLTSASSNPNSRLGQLLRSARAQGLDAAWVARQLNNEILEKPYLRKEFGDLPFDEIMGGGPLSPMASAAKRMLEIGLEGSLNPFTDREAVGYLRGSIPSVYGAMTDLAKIKGNTGITMESLIRKGLDLGTKPIDANHLNMLGRVAQGYDPELLAGVGGQLRGVTELGIGLRRGLIDQLWEDGITEDEMPAFMRLGGTREGYRSFIDTIRTAKDSKDPTAINAMKEKLKKLAPGVSEESISKLLTEGRIDNQDWLAIGRGAHKAGELGSAGEPEGIPGTKELGRVVDELAATVKSLNIKLQGDVPVLSGRREVP